MKVDWKKWLLIVIGTISWSLTMIKSGWVYPYGMGFWGANGHDGIWHIALAESLSKGSWGMPMFSGSNLQNYHIGFDLLLSLVHKLTLIPVVNLYFQVLPLIFAALIGVLTYKFVFEWIGSKKSALWSTFFVYFGGSFGWILGKGESAFWSTQAISTLINPPFALSLIFILLGLIFLLRRKFILAAICFGVLIEVKAYAGILVLGALLVSGIYKFVKEKKFDFLTIFSGSLVISLLLYFSFNKNSASLLVWQPFWFLETLMGPDRLSWTRFYSAMTTYRMGGIWIKGIPAYLAAFAIFWIGNMGTRIIKEVLVWKWIKNLKTVSWVEIFIASVIIAGGIIPMFFLQKGTSWNTIQFFYYSLFFSGILAGVTLERIKSKSLLVLIVLFTIPTTIDTLWHVYIPSRPPAKLSNEELTALKFLSTQPSGAVLTYPFDQAKANEAESSPPRPLYLYTSTAYVSAFSGHATLLEDEINLDITGYDWHMRRAEVEAWYKEKNTLKAQKFLKDNNIKYVYWVKPQRALLTESQLGLKAVFENEEVTIYQVD